MTQKELLYIDDAYGHECNIINIGNNIIENLSDQSLVSFMKREIKKHETMKNNLLKILEDKANE